MNEEYDVIVLGTGLTVSTTGGRTDVFIAVLKRPSELFFSSPGFGVARPA